MTLFTIMSGIYGYMRSGMIVDYIIFFSTDMIIIIATCFVQLQRVHKNLMHVDKHSSLLIINEIIVVRTFNYCFPPLKYAINASIFFFADLFVLVPPAPYPYFICMQSVQACISL